MPTLRPCTGLALPSPRVLLARASGLSLYGVGQMLGYAFGAGHSPEKLADYEFRQVDHVRPEERVLFDSRVHVR